MALTPSPKLLWVEEKPPKVFPPAAQFLDTLPDEARETLTAQLDKASVVQIAFDAYNDAMTHVTGHRMERVGLLLGDVYTAHDESTDTKRFLVRITDAIGCEDNTATGVSVNIHPSAWLAVQPYIDKGKTVIGWFHSHPNLGAFFSGTDRATQRDVFGEDYSVGWVIDWVRNEQTWYVGKDSRQIRDR